MRVQVSELKELMDLTRCDSLVNPVKCNMKACESINILEIPFFFQIFYIFLPKIRFMERWYW
jgi:hypothetical protein